MAVAKFRGPIEQTPPPYSAKKIKGVPAYKLARKQKEVHLDPVHVEIKELTVLGVDVDRMRFRARVTSGTYMRSVAHDLGKALGCGAHLESLRRTAVAEFTIDESHTLEELAAAEKLSTSVERAPRPLLAIDTDSDLAMNPISTIEVRPSEGRLDDTVEERPLQGRVQGKDEVRGFSPGETSEAEGISQLIPQPLLELFIHPRKLLPQLPSVTADESTAARIRAGRTVNLLDLSRSRQVKVFASQRDLIAIATRVAGTLFHAKIVLCVT